MWTCKRCTAEVKSAQAEAQIDSFGVFFICPCCGRRNKLVNAGTEGRIALVQAADWFDYSSQYYRPLAH
ncbi:MAG: hypothetical protein QM639_16670 [Rhodocyclaceae bacterium]